MKHIVVTLLQRVNLFFTALDCAGFLGFPLKAGQRWSRKPIQMNHLPALVTIHFMQKNSNTEAIRHASHALLRQIDGKGHSKA